MASRSTMADLRHLGFYGSNNGFFEKPMYTTSYRSLIETTALNCLVFFCKKRIFTFWDQDLRWRISAILDFKFPVMGSLKKPMCDFLYLGSSIDTVSLNCLVFEKIAFFAFWRQTDRQTNRRRRTNRWTAPNPMH